MRIRFGLCLLPAVLASACTTAENAAPTTAAVSPPAPPETFAMLPDAVAVVPYGVGQDVPKLVAASYVSPDGPRTVPGAFVKSGSMEVPATSSNPEVDRLITTYAANYEVPESLVRRVVKRESNFRPGARNGKYWGLMQILPATARSLGYDGPPQGLLDAETNLKYAVKYLKGAFMVAGGDHDQAVRNYSRGYYYEAKRKGMLATVGDFIGGRTRKPAAVMVASAGMALPATSTAANPAVGNIAQQWETGFATATNGQTKTAAALPADSRFGGPKVIAASATRTVGGNPSIGFAANTPSLGMASGPAQ